MTLVATSLSTGSATEAGRTLVDSLLAKLAGAPAQLVLVFASTKQPLAELCPVVAAAFPGVPVLAASTAGEFVETGDRKGAVAALAVAGDFRVYAGMAEGLKADAEGAVRGALDGQPTAVAGFPHRTALMLLDPLAGNGEEATLLAAALLGDGVRLAGGAAGDDLAMARTFVGLGARAASDAVVIAQIFSKKPLGVGVCHGHQPISDVVRVTRSVDNVVHEVDGRPAWDVWAEKTRAAAASRGVDVDRLADADVGGYLLRYEAGLSVGDEYKIRAPLVRNDDGSIGFACGIPEGTTIRITESVEARQIESARTAARRALEGLKGARAAGAVVFDCICRNLILADDFRTAVTGMSEELGGVPLAGFETYGEIALDVGDMSGFHNTTSVVLAFPD